MILRRLVVLAAVALVLTSCAPSAEGELEFGEPTHGPRAESMIAADCDELTSDRAFELAFETMPEATDPAVLEYLSRATIPEAASLRAAGGLACQWIVPDSDTYVGVLLRVLPDASDDWRDYADATGISEYEDWCYDILPAHCVTQSLVRGMWVESTTDGGGILEASVALTNTLVYSVEGTTPTAVRWVGADGERRACDELTDAATASAALGREADVFRVDEGLSVVASAERLAGVTTCGINERGSELASVSILPDGVWMWTSVLEQLPLEEHIVVEGADDATIRCGEGCTLDLAVRGDWIRVGTLPELADPRASALALAAAIAAQP